MGLLAVTANNIITINKVGLNLPEIHFQMLNRDHKTKFSAMTLVLRLGLFPQDQNVFDSKKKVKLTNAEGVEYKLAKKQLQAIDFNKALLAMYTNQVRV